MTYNELMIAYKKADIAMKETNGHSFETILKTRCIYCHRSPRAKGRCRHWFERFLRCLSCELTGIYGLSEPDNELRK